MSGFTTRLKQYRVRFIVGIGLAAVIGLAIWIEHGDAPAAVPQAPPAVPVGTAIARRADVPLYLEGLGTVQAFNTDAVTTRVDGQVQNIAFADGQDVKAGDTLAQIDPRPFQAVYDQSVATKAKDEAQLANARLDLTRFQSLWAQNAIAQQMFTAQQAMVAQLGAQVKMDQAAIDAAKANLDYTTIRSPISGRAGIRQIDMGNNLLTSANTTVVVVTQLQPIAVVFSLPEEDLPEVTNGSRSGALVAIVLSRDNKTELDRGNIVVLDNEVNQTSGTLKMKATFPNAHEKLWPGDFVNVKLLVGMDRNVVTVPATAIQRGADGQFAYVVNPGPTVAIRPVSLARFQDNSAVIRSGLEPGEMVVTAGQYRLQPGSRVGIPRTELALLRASRLRKRG
jgi:multidrug efflux system membrane fusion protein